MSNIIEKDWVTASDLRAVVLICLNGERKTHRCGYVGVPVGHVLHGIGYSDQIPEITPEMVNNQRIGKKSPILLFTASVDADSEDSVRRSPDVLFDCHGGITYAGGKDNYPVESDLWWFGFDCMHSGDGDIEADPHRPRDGEVRTLDYVERECESLAAQIAEYFAPREAQ